MESTGLTIQAAVNFFRNELENLYESSELEQILHLTFLHLFNLNRIDLTLKSDEIISSGDIKKLNEVISELKEYKPLAYIIGEWEFYNLSLYVNKHTLIPRPETEELVQLIIEENKNKKATILDIGTGSGCIALALKRNIVGADIYAYDISEEALVVANKNAKRNNLEINFKKVDILNWSSENDLANIDIVVSNPPYISLSEKEDMHKNVLDFEPEKALFVDNKKPLLFYDVISDFALNNLKKGGKLYFEINERYGKEVVNLLFNKGFVNPKIIKDINGKDRIVKTNFK